MSRRLISSGSPYEPQVGFSRAVVVGDRILVAGTAPVPLPGEAVSPSVYSQMMRCGAIVAEALADAGSSLREVVRTRMFIVDAADAGEVSRAHRELFGDAMPAATMVVVAALLDPEWKVEIEVEAVKS